MDDYMLGAGFPGYAVSPDDRRFVMLRRESGASAVTYLVTNWFEELRERMGEN